MDYRPWQHDDVYNIYIITAADCGCYVPETHNPRPVTIPDVYIIYIYIMHTNRHPLTGHAPYAYLKPIIIVIILLLFIIVHTSIFSIMRLSFLNVHYICLYKNRYTYIMCVGCVFCWRMFSKIITVLNIIRLCVNHLSQIIIIIYILHLLYYIDIP